MSYHRKFRKLKNTVKNNAASLTTRAKQTKIVELQEMLENMQKHASPFFTNFILKSFQTQYKNEMRNQATKDII